jgi:hypothetical protein
MISETEVTIVGSNQSLGPHNVATGGYLRNGPNDEPCSALDGIALLNIRCRGEEMTDIAL